MSPWGDLQKGQDYYMDVEKPLSNSSNEKLIKI